MAKGFWANVAAVGLGLLMVAACRQVKPEVDSCLKDVDANALPQALDRCNRVVAAHLNDPRPLNDRFLLHTLLQNKAAACADISKAAAMVKTKGDLKDEIEVRLDSCRIP